MADLNDLRKEYEEQERHKADLLADPIKQFDRWFNAALRQNVREPNGAALATVDQHGQPSVRTVLLKYYDANGFVFFTNYTSRKSQQLDANPKAALLFWWSETVQQISIEGRVERLDPEHSDLYFAKRDRASQLAAWASQQSQVITSRDELMQRYHALEQQYQHESNVPRPPFWGGYVIKPTRIEFWHGVAHRLHDRFCYELGASGEWQLNRLAP